MDNFSIIYKILKALEAAMDLPEFEIEQISNEVFNISSERWSRYIEMMVDMGLIKGVRVYNDITGGIRVEDNDIRITLKGLEYLTENSIMQKMYKIAKGIKEITPLV